MRKAFTLIELLIAVSILSVCAGVVFSTFSVGLNTWRRISGYNLKEREVILFLKKIEQELRNSFAFANIKFEGEQQRITFPSLVWDEKREVYVPGQISYSFNPREKMLTRGEKTYYTLFSSAGKEGGKRIMAVEQVNFAYYFYHKDAHNYGWGENYTGFSPPWAVRIRVLMEEGEKNRTIEKRVIIPLGKEKWF